MGEHCCGHETEAGARALTARLEAHCRARGLRMTEARRAALEVVARADGPVGPYEVAAALGAHPPTAYRALEFLEREGFVHRIASRGAFVACQSGRGHAGTQFLICDTCGAVETAPAPALPAALTALAEGRGFAPARWATELHGVCAACRGAGADRGRARP
jgi:Fur family transcriptional regulator, zinc uptake regulator